MFDLPLWKETAEKISVSRQETIYDIFGSIFARKTGFLPKKVLHISRNRYTVIHKDLGRDVK
jgi:hypothetical protein